MKIKRATLVVCSAAALVVGLAGVASGEDYNQGDDAPGCIPWVSGPVLPNSCGAGIPEQEDPNCDIATMTEPNCGRPNGAGGWEPDPIIQEQLPEEVIGRAYDNGCYQQTIDFVYCPPIEAAVTPAPEVRKQVKTQPMGGVSAGDGSSYTGTDTYL